MLVVVGVARRRQGGSHADPADAGTREDRTLSSPAAAWRGVVSPLDEGWGDFWNIRSGITPEKLQTRKPPILRTTHRSVSRSRRHVLTRKEPAPQGGPSGLLHWAGRVSGDAHAGPLCSAISLLWGSRKVIRPRTPAAPRSTGKDIKPETATPPTWRVRGTVAWGGQPHPHFTC